MWRSINKVSLKILKNILIPQLLLHQLYYLDKGENNE